MDKKINILVVDDEQIVLDSVTKHLRKKGYVLHCVLSSQEALDKMKNSEIDIVLTDLMMPDIDGLELMTLVKEDKPNLPVVMITGYATINTALRATQLGAFDYIAKPFSKKELLAVVQRAADLVKATPADSDQLPTAQEAIDLKEKEYLRSFKRIGDQSWLVLQEDGIVIMGVERSFLEKVGKIQTVYLPSKGDEIRQGSVYLQVFSSDLRSHNALSPLSGIVIDVNQRVIDDPASTLEDPYEKGWLVHIKPSRFDFEIKLLGL